ncbi:MAG: Z1 domain-containing protein [Actinomyces sp.]|uniref:Z1 domain-containing protein n=1 Tax=Actinomyces sp. TaxID=29317 RepID=UPI0026DB4ED8|nr:Z1 domain-containing protein [Actinomyces sp.]MDO4242828.1 Z1 domain-containing protein [Actinomyces sp.]
MTPQTAGWEPQVGSEATAMLERSGLEPEQQSQVLGGAKRVLSRCVSPHDWNRREKSAELVVGEVQSGKTMSFTALTALAHDNRFPLVILLAGTKVNLMEQTFNRLHDDLQMEGDGGIPTWRPLNLRKEREPNDIASLISSARKSSTTTHTTTIAVVLKNAKNLGYAKDLVSTLTQQCGRFPALIIDDEGDQAGLNLLAKKSEESASYKAIRELRDSLPLHSYVIYTATPQAPLLVSLEDTVSPRTVTVLQHSPGYVGGEELFINRRNSFVRAIDDNDDALDTSLPTPPKSFQTALATFLIALVVTQERGRPRPLSMLIHPSSETDLHEVYETWVTSVLHDRIQIAFDSGDRMLFEQLRDSMFRVAYDDLDSTGGTTVGTEKLSLDTILEHLKSYLASIRVRSVNSKNGVDIDSRDWRGSPGWIVIGGAKLDRGFTIENLAVTYMPRSPGIKNADTIQQRGRFFGYRQNYLDVLRAWINPETIDVYRNYVEHEKTMRSSLIELDEDGSSLGTWRRSFLLDESMNLTRSQVIALDLDSLRMSRGWFVKQEHLYIEHIGPSDKHLDLLHHLKHEASVDPRDHRKGPERRNMLVEVDWSTIAPILADWNAHSEERTRIAAFIMSINSLTPPPKVDLLFMDNLEVRDRAPLPSKKSSGREFSTSNSIMDHRKIANIHQGPSRPTHHTGYAGDAKFRSQAGITVQIHCIQPKMNDENWGPPALALALHSPEEGTRVIQQRR